MTIPWEHTSGVAFTAKNGYLSLCIAIYWDDTNVAMLVSEFRVSVANFITSLLD